MSRLGSHNDLSSWDLGFRISLEYNSLLFFLKFVCKLWEVTKLGTSTMLFKYKECCGSYVSMILWSHDFVGLI